MIIFKNNIIFLYFWSVFSLPGSVPGPFFPFHDTDPDLAKWYGSDQIRIHNTGTITYQFDSFIVKRFLMGNYTPVLLFKVPVCGGRLFTVDTSSRTLQTTQIKLKEEYLVWWIKQGFKLETFVIVMFVCFHAYIFVLYVYAYVWRKDYDMTIQRDHTL